MGLGGDITWGDAVISRVDEYIRETNQNMFQSVSICIENLGGSLIFVSCFLR